MSLFVSTAVCGRLLLLLYVFFLLASKDGTGSHPHLCLIHFATLSSLLWFPLPCPALPFLALPCPALLCSALVPFAPPSPLQTPLQGAIAWIQVTFSSHSQLVNILLFYLAFSLLVIGLFPLGVIDLAAGFLFGAWTGFPVALATKTSGSVLCFILSRHTCRSGNDKIASVRKPKYLWHPFFLA